MRWTAVLVLLVACDLQPKGDKVAPSPAPATPPDGGAAPAPPRPNPPPIDIHPTARVDAGVRPPLIETTDACTEVGVHVAEVKIASATDPAIKAQLEQERTRLVRRVAEACTRVKWNEAVRKCFLDGKTDAEIAKCGENLAAPE